MLTLSITFFLLALLIAGFGVYGTIGGGAMFFALGFLVLATISMLSHFRGHPA